MKPISFILGIFLFLCTNCHPGPIRTRTYTYYKNQTKFSLRISTYNKLVKYNEFSANISQGENYYYGEETVELSIYRLTYPPYKLLHSDSVEVLFSDGKKLVYYDSAKFLQVWQRL